MKTRYNKIIFILFFILILINKIFCITIKLGSSAPANSPWHKCLKDIANKWNEVSEGDIILKIYPGSIAGDEAVMIRKMRLRQLHSAAITNVGLNKIHRGILALSFPMLILDENELDYVLQRTNPIFEAELEKKGFKVLLCTFLGWAHFFSKKPIRNPDDLKKLKLWVWEESSDEIQAWKKAGFMPVPLPIPDVMTSLQSGMVEAFTGTKLTAAIFQWFGIANHMCELNWTPTIAYIIISNNIWGKIPEDLRPKLLQIAQEAGENITKETKKIDQEALSIMKENGLMTHPVSDEIIQEWKKTIDANFATLINNKVGEKSYDMIKKHVNTYRALNDQKEQN